MGRAMELILTGKVIDAEEAYRIGLANEVVPKGCAGSGNAITRIARKTVRQGHPESSADEAGSDPVNWVGRFRKNAIWQELAALAYRNQRSSVL